jgi:hypothetical protein
MHISIRDDQGNRIESGDVYPYSEEPELWWFLPTAYVPIGTPVIVRVTAEDTMGGVATRWIWKTMGEDWK